MTIKKITPSVEQFLAEQSNLILATIQQDGRPQQSPVWFLWSDGAFHISTLTRTAKWQNLLRDPRCSAIVDDPRGRYVYVSGVAELDDGDVYESTLEIVKRYKQSSEIDAYMDSIFNEGHRTIIRLAPERFVARNFT